MTELLSSRRAVPVFVVLLVLILVFFIRLCVLIPYIGAPTEGQPSIYTPGTILSNRQGGRPVQALYQIEVEAATTGWTPDLYRSAGDIWRSMGDMPQAIAYWEAAAQLNPDDTSLAFVIAEGYVSLGRWADALDALEYYLQFDPDNHRTHYMLGLILAPFNPPLAAQHLQVVIGDPQYNTTATALLEVLETDSIGSISMNVGRVLAEHDLWIYAEIAFRHAAVVDYPSGAALAYTGLAREMQGKDGTEWVEQALALEPLNPQVLYVAGLHLRIRQEYQASRRILIRAASQAPDNPAFYAEIGMASRLLGDYQQAERWYQMAVIMSDYDPLFVRALSLFYAEEAYGIDPLNPRFDPYQPVSDDPDVLAAYGWTLHMQGDSRAGLVQIDAALAINPQHPRALYERGRILLENGDITGAAALFERVSGLNSPYANLARRILDSIG